MQKVKVMCLVLSAALAAGCATLHRSMSVGVGIGVGTGAVANMAATDGKGALKGALFGAAIGAASSYLIHGALQKRDSKTRRQTLLNLDKFSVSATRLFVTFASSLTPSSVHCLDLSKLSAPDVDKECGKTTKYADRSPLESGRYKQLSRVKRVKCGRSGVMPHGKQTQGGDE